MLVCDVFIIVAAVRVWYDVKQDLPAGRRDRARRRASSGRGRFVHPGAGREARHRRRHRTVDELHVEVDKTYHFKLESRDVLHSFSVPVFRLKQDAIPGRVITGWFEATKTGTYDIQCAEICGIGHGLMAGAHRDRDARSSTRRGSPAQPTSPSQLAAKPSRRRRHG